MPIWRCTACNVALNRRPAAGCAWCEAPATALVQDDSKQARWDLVGAYLLRGFFWLLGITPRDISHRVQQREARVQEELSPGQLRKVRAIKRTWRLMAGGGIFMLLVFIGVLVMFIGYRPILLDLAAYVRSHSGVMGWLISVLTALVIGIVDFVCWTISFLFNGNFDWGAGSTDRTPSTGRDIHDDPDGLQIAAVIQKLIKIKVTHSIGWALLSTPLIYYIYQAIDWPAFVARGWALVPIIILLVILSIVGTIWNFIFTIWALLNVRVLLRLLFLIMIVEVGLQWKTGKTIPATTASRSSTTPDL